MRSISWRESAIFVLLLAFSGLWYVLAGSLTAWSDEISHLAAAKGLLMTGEPFEVLFDHCAELLSQQYRRSLEISQWTALSYELFGESLRSARLVPFLWTMASWGLYVVYARVRGALTPAHCLIATILFFGQSMILEHALYVRMYAPLLFILLLALVILWEAQQAWQHARQRRRAMLWSTVACLLIAYPTLRGWHVLQVAIFLLAGVLLWWHAHPGTLRSIQRVWRGLVALPRGWRYVLLGVALYALLCVWLVSPRIVDVLAARLLGAVRVHATPWDNLMGLLRMGWALNVVFFLWLWRRSKAPRTLDFDSWLLNSGILSGLLIGLFMNSTHIFYSKYFYLSVGIAVLGAAGKLARMPVRSGRVAAIAGYLVANAALSGLTLGVERSNITTAIAWLRAHSSEQDLIFSFRAELSLHGGERLCHRTISIVSYPESANDRAASQGFSWIRRDAHSSWLIGEEVQAVLAQHPSSEVYFLYTDDDQFRNWLYARTTGRPQPVSHPPGYYNLQEILMGPELSESIIPGLRQCGLRRVNRSKLLQVLAAGGYIHA